MKATSITRRFRTALGSAMLGITLAATLAACGTPAGAVATTAVTATLVTPTAAPVIPTATPITPTVVTPPPTATATATRTPQIWCDSFWKIEANAWIDSDGNGKQDADELPLAGVEFKLSGYGRGLSDEAGRYVSRPISGCGSTPTFTLTATPPDGYALTTPGVVQFQGDGKAAFGFVAK